MINDELDLSQEIDDVLEGVEKKQVQPVEKEEKSVEKVQEQDLTVMGRMLGQNPVTMPKISEKITGKVIQVDTYALYVDLGVLGTGIVYGKEIKDGFGVGRKKLQIGDEITASVVDLENEDGYVELSVSEAIREEAWGDLKKKRDDKVTIATKILDANKGGLIVEINGITGFMPVSQLTAEHYPRVEDGDKNKILEILKSYVGTEMTVCVLDADETEEKLIASEKEAYREREKTAVAELKRGDVIEGEVSGVVDFGAFVKFLPPSKKETGREEDKLEGLVHISQLDWQLIDDPRKVVKAGDRVRAKIIAIDDTRISLSIRELKNDPWEKVAERYKTGDQVAGRVHKINHFGAFVYLDKDIHGLAHVSSFPGYPKKPIDEAVKIEGEYAWEIMSLEPNEHRMGLRFLGEKSKLEKKKSAKEADEKVADEKSDDAEKEESESAKPAKKKGSKTKEEKE